MSPRQVGETPGDGSLGLLIESWGRVSCLPDSQSPCALVSSEADDLTAVGMVRGLQCSVYTRLSFVGIWEIQGSETHSRLPSIALHQQSAWLIYLEKLRHKKQPFPQLQGDDLEWQVGKSFFFFKIIFGAPNPVESLRSAEGLGLLGEGVAPWLGSHIGTMQGPLGNSEACETRAARLWMHKRILKTVVFKKVYKASNTYVFLELKEFHLRQADSSLPILLPTFTLPLLCLIFPFRT